LNLLRRLLTMRTWTVASMALALGCGAGSGADGDGGDGTSEGCSAPAPACLMMYGSCCEDIAFDATCDDGQWICDACVLGASICAGHPETCMMRDCTRTTRDAVRLGIPLDEYCEVGDGG
jgi:hypothetical protein